MSEGVRGKGADGRRPKGRRHPFRRKRSALKRKPRGRRISYPTAAPVPADFFPEPTRAEQEESLQTVGMSDETISDLFEVLGVKEERPKHGRR